MAYTNKAFLGPVPKDISRELSEFLTSIREHVQIQGGMGRGSDLDRAVTMRDWVGANGSKNLSVSKLMSSSNTDVLHNDPSPYTPTGVQLFAAFNTVMVKWDIVKAPWYANTEIFRLSVKVNLLDPLNPIPYVEVTQLNVITQQTPQFTVAAHVGTTFSTMFTDEIPSDSYAVYWVRHVNRDGVAGPVHLPRGSLAHTHATPEDVIREYSRAIYDGENFKWLRSSIGLMDTLNRSIQGAFGPDSNFGSMFDGASTITDLLAERSLATSLDSHSSRSELSAQFSKNLARITGGVHAAVNLSSAYASRIQTLEAKWNVGGALDSAIQAKIDAYDLVAVSPTGAIALGVKDYNVSFNGVNVTLQTLASAVASNDAKYETQWGVKSKVGDLSGGVGFYNNGSITSFLVDANVFAVTDGMTLTPTSVVPFMVRNGKVVMNTAVINDADIMTLIAGSIVAESVAANVSINSPVISGGSISGTTLDIAGVTTIDANGTLVSVNAFLKGLTITDSAGNVILDSSGIRGSYIKNLVVDSVSIKDQAVTSPHSVLISDANLAKGTSIVTDYPIGLYVGGGIQYALSIEAVLLTGNISDASLRVNIEVLSGTTVVYSNFTNIYSTTYLYVSSGSLCGMSDAATLTSSLGQDLVFRITVFPAGGGTPFLRVKVSGFVSYAKR